MSAATMLRFLENHPTGAIMAEETKDDRVTLEQLMVSTLAMTDAMIKLLIKKGIFTDAEFKAELILSARTYLAVLKRLH